MRAVNHPNSRRLDASLLDTQRRDDACDRVKQFALEAAAVTYLQTPLGATAELARGLIVARLQAVLFAGSALPS